MLKFGSDAAVVAAEKVSANASVAFFIFIVSVVKVSLRKSFGI